jgi:hypothetical protein
MKKIGLIIVSVVAVVAMVGVVGVASAQDQTPMPDRPGRLGQERGFPRLMERIPLLGDLLQIVADDLGVQPEDITGQMRGQTLAEVIAANGGDVEQISADLAAAITDRVNEAVASGDLTQERADAILANLGDMVQRALEGEGRLHQLRDRLHQPFAGDTRPLINAVVNATGLTGQEIIQEMRSGKTLGEVIAEHGMSADTVVAEAVAQVKETLDQAVTNGRLTQEQEDAMLNGLEAFYDTVLNGAFRPQASTDV